MDHASIRRVATSLVLLAVSACGGGEPAPPAPATPTVAAVLDALLPEGRRTLAPASLSPLVALEPGQDLRAVELGRDAHTSHHLVAIRDREPLHRHERHDLLVVILRGHGGMQLGDEVRSVGPGSILYVPRGARHAFRNEAPEPAVAYTVYVPAFDGRDRVPE
jgi:mannose-6-phosphate isomerase-like protein (cupin superfamily)